MQVIKAIIFFNKQFWLIPISLASCRLICTSPSLLWRLQGRRANGKEKWSSNCGFVIIAQLSTTRLSIHRSHCDQPSSPPHPLHSHLLSQCVRLTPHRDTGKPKHYCLLKLNLAHVCYVWEVLKKKNPSTLTTDRPWLITVWPGIFFSFSLTVLWTCYAFSRNCTPNLEFGSLPRLAGRWCWAAAASCSSWLHTGRETVTTVFCWLAKPWCLVDSGYETHLLMFSTNDGFMGM